MIRALFKRDLDQLKSIHERFYQDEFSLSDLNRFISSFAVIDDSNGKIITAGGIRSIVETIIVTDKDTPIEKRQEALIDLLQVAKNTTKQAGYTQLHAFVQDAKWMRHLISHGFIPTVGKSLVIGV